MASYRIIRMNEISRNDEERNIIPVRVIRYMVGKHGPFTYQTDSKDYSADKVAAILEAQAQEILKLEGT